MCKMLSKNRIKYVRRLDSAKFRHDEGVFVAEGGKVVEELLGTYACKYVAGTSEWTERNGRIVESLRRRGVEVDTISDGELRSLSLQETPQEVLAVMEQAQWEVDIAEASAGNLCLALDAVQNPGNLGTIVRIADWFGIKDVFAGMGCADLYNPKTVQATMGAMARVRVHKVDLPELLAGLEGNVPVYGTFLDGDCIYDRELGCYGVIVMGNEGKGVSPAVASRVTERLFVPSWPEGVATSESLNVGVATAVVCAEFRRRQRL